jgi:hypothetical protein
MYAILAWQCLLLGIQMWTVGRVSDTMLIPVFPFIYVLALGCAINCFVLLIDLVRHLVALRSSTETGNGTTAVVK